MKTPRFFRAFEMPRRSFLKLAAATTSSFAALRLPAQSAERKPPVGDGKLHIIVFGAHPDDCELSAGGQAPSGPHRVTTSSSSPARTATSAIGAWRAGGLLNAARRKSGRAPRFLETNPKCSTSTTANSW